jgi:hypothetical protein
MKTTTKTAKLALAAILLTFCLACEEKEKAKTAADEVARTETEALAKAKAEAEAAEAFAKETRAAAKIKCTSSGNSSEQTDGVKLLECITDDNGTVYKKFEYDKQNRIVKMYDYHSVDGGLYYTKMITYADDWVKAEDVWSNSKSVTNYVKNRNEIKVEREGKTIKIDENGYIVSEESEYFLHTYKYSDGNLIGGKDIYAFDNKHDNKKSPYSNTSTPKWLLQDLLGSSSADKNNVLEYSFGGTASIEYGASQEEVTGSGKYKYEYDSDGFPTKQTLKQFRDGEESTTITRFTYRGGMKN